MKQLEIKKWSTGEGYNGYAAGIFFFTIFLYKDFYYIKFFLPEKIKIKIKTFKVGITLARLKQKQIILKLKGLID